MNSRMLTRNKLSACSSLPATSAHRSLPLGVVPGSAHGSPGHQGEARQMLGSTRPAWLAWAMLGRRVRPSSVGLLFEALPLDARTV